MKLIALIAIAVWVAVGFVIFDDKDATVVQAPAQAADPLAALRATVPVPTYTTTAPPSPAAAAPKPRRNRPRYTLATVLPGRHVQLLDSPRGSLVARLGDRTEFGSPRTFWVAATKGDWLGVPSPQLPDNRLGWIRDDRTKLDLSETGYSVDADVSEQAIELRWGERVLDRFPVTVGSPGSPTPLGAYAVTDGIAGKTVGSAYGCCVLALTGHQPNLPPGWLGGDRIAIHGTPEAVGGAKSSGCLRASDPDMVSLFARVPLGTPVFVHA